MLAHRIGLIPLNIDPDKFEQKKRTQLFPCAACTQKTACYEPSPSHLSHRRTCFSIHDVPTAGEEEANEKNTVVFKLNVRCKRGKGNVMEGSKGKLQSLTIIQQTSRRRVAVDRESPLFCSAVFASEFEWLPNGSEMPEETNCRFAAGQSGLLQQPAGPVRPPLAFIFPW